MCDQQSLSLTVDLGPTFGSDINRIRNGQVSWLADIDGIDSPIFTIEIPLELVGVTPNPVASGRNTSLEFVQQGEVTVRGIELDPHTCDILCAGGGMAMSVDSLSRSILLTDVDERTFIDALQAQTEITTEQLDTLRRTLLVPALFDVLDDATATETTTQLKRNIRAHEREHVRCLIEPESALWRELELYWCSVLLCTKSLTWRHPEVLNRIAALYGIPSRFTAEILAILNEPYAIDNPAIKRAVEPDIAEQRGTANTLVQFLTEYAVDPETFTATLRSPEGEQYCDLWLAYILDHIRSGGALDEIDPTDFHERLDPVMEPHGDPICDPSVRTEFIDFIQTQSRGPVVELVRLKFVDGEFVLERTWCSLNDQVPNTECLVAVRRVLFRRQFFTRFTVDSGLKAMRDDREAAVKRIIHGTSLEDESPFNTTLPSPDILHSQLQSVYKTVTPALLGAGASVEDLRAWLNDPDYGFQSNSR